MKYITYSLCTILSCLTLLSLQLQLLRYEDITNMHLMMIACTYSLFAPLHIAVTALLILCIDIIHFLSTGYFGYMLLTMTSISIFFTMIKDNFYNKLCLPLLFIIVCNLISYTFCWYVLQHHYLVLQPLQAIMVQSFGLICLWLLSQKELYK